MNERPNISSSVAPDGPDDWLDQLLARDAGEHASHYIGDEGFTARVIAALPAANALPAWRKPIVAALWLIAAALFATMLPEAALDVARETFKLLAARPFSLSTVALVIGAMGIATWTGAAVVLRRD